MPLTANSVTWGGDSMKRLLTLVIIGFTLTACEVVDGELITGGKVQLVHWFYSEGLTSGQVLNPLDGGDISETLDTAVRDQDSVIRLEKAREFAEEISTGLPDMVDISISWITVPDLDDDRSAQSVDGCGGFMTTLMANLSSNGADYTIQGDTVICEETFHITRSKMDDDVPYTVRVKQYVLHHRQSGASSVYESATQFAEPRSDPPAMLEKRAGSRPGW
ncbi:hypothetical protein ACFL39_02020 [Gemmatimonadota bacterium]